MTPNNEPTLLQPLPPKQVGPLSHRRVLSTGDASVMSVLTDPDSGLEDASSPFLVPMAGQVVVGGGGNNHVLPVSSNSRKRGVSWDLKEHYRSSSAVVGTAGGQQQQQQQHPATTSSGGPFSTEEQAAFQTLGILQPILMDDIDNNNDDDGGDMGGFGLEDLMQPVLDDHHHHRGVVVGTEHSQVARQQQQQQKQRQLLQQSPPLPPENILPLKPPSISTPPPPPSLNNKPTSSRRAMFSASRRSQNMKSITQFEDEAHNAIMEALSMYNLEQSEFGDLKIQQQLQKQAKEEEEEQEVKAEENEQDEANDLVSGIPHHVVRATQAHHTADVSAITLGDGLGLEHSPIQTSIVGAAAVGNDGGGIHTFEDAAWHDGYDSQGRIDGTLVEERESKYIEEELGIDLNAGLNSLMNPDTSGEAASVASSSRKQMGGPKATSVSESDQASVHSRGTDLSKGSKGSKASKDRPGSPSKTGLRHRRTGTRGSGVLSAAQELAAMTTIDESDESEFNKGHFKIESDGHGIGNLLDGATLLLEQQKKLDGGGDYADDDEGMPFIAEETSIDMEHEDDAPHDEETGDANPNGKRHKRTPTNLFGRRREKPTMKQRNMERRFRMKMWYDDLIAPRIPIFVKAATHAFFFVMMPLLFVAIMLYYAAGNPMTGNKRRTAQLIESGEIESGEFQGSWSWWILFILRQFIILSCVKAGEVISIDVIALRTPIFVKVFGSFATLMFVQARGWPYVITFWGVCE